MNFSLRLLLLFSTMLPVCQAVPPRSGQVRQQRSADCVGGNCDSQSHALLQTKTGHARDFVDKARTEILQQAAESHVGPADATNNAGEHVWEIDDEETIDRLEELGEDNVDPAEATTTTVTPQVKASLLTLFGVPCEGEVVVCGGHCAETCADCPEGNGASWCNGGCRWNGRDCVPPPELSEENPYGCPEQQNGNWPGGPCKARTASIHLNWARPDQVQDPTWYYNEITVTNASTATYYATNTHRYGYAGIQMVRQDDYSDARKILCSTWDNDAGNAKVEHCGEGVSCVGFGGEGTGAKAIMNFRWTMGNRYAWMLKRAPLDNNRVENSCWFYAEEFVDAEENPSGWKHIVTTSTGVTGSSIAFQDAGSFLEQWTHDDTQESRDAQYGPAWYKSETGNWAQATLMRFSSYALPERLENDEVVEDTLSAGKDPLPYMSTGGMKIDHQSDALHQNPRNINGITTQNVPAPITAFNDNAAELLSQGCVSGAAESSTCPTPSPTPAPTVATPAPTVATPAPTVDANSISCGQTVEFTIAKKRARWEPVLNVAQGTQVEISTCGLSIGGFDTKIYGPCVSDDACGRESSCSFSAASANPTLEIGGYSRRMGTASLKVTCTEPTSPPVPETTVSCGGHRAATCAECPQGNGAGWCNGDCQWRANSCQSSS